MSLLIVLGMAIRQRLHFKASQRPSGGGPSRRQKPALAAGGLGWRLQCGREGEEYGRKRGVAHLEERDNAGALWMEALRPKHRFRETREGTEEDSTKWNGPIC